MSDIVDGMRFGGQACCRSCRRRLVEHEPAGRCAPVTSPSCWRPVWTDGRYSQWRHTAGVIEHP